MCDVILTQSTSRHIAATKHALDNLAINRDLFANCNELNSSKTERFFFSTFSNSRNVATKLYLSVHNVINLLNHFILTGSVYCKLVSQEGQCVCSILKSTQEKNNALCDNFCMCQTWSNNLKQPAVQIIITSTNYEVMTLW